MFVESNGYAVNDYSRTQEKDRGRFAEEIRDHIAGW
jgi:hypothetical protein